MAVTLKQIAKEVGVTPMTVSYALRQDRRISPATRGRVEAAARRLGYRPNLAARSLRGGGTDTVGLITGALNVEVTSLKVQAFDDAAREAGYVTMMTFSPNNGSEFEDHVINKLRDRQVDGIVVYPTERGEHLELRRLVDEGFPVVTLDGVGRIDFETDDISADYYQTGRLQVEHLVSLGHRRLCHIQTFPNCYTKEQLRLGALDAAKEFDLPEPLLCDIDVPHDCGSFAGDAAHQQVRGYLSEHHNEIDAILSYDLNAAIALRAAYELGIRVPDDLSIIGSDNCPTAHNSVVPLTSIAQPSDVIGRMAFELIRERIRHPRKKSAAFKQHRVEPRLVVRQSTAKCKTPGALEGTAK